MRIVHVTQFIVPERGYQDYYLTDAQQRLGHEVFVLSSRGSEAIDTVRKHYTDAYLYNAGLERFPNGVMVHRVDAYQLSTRLFLRGLGRELRRLRPDWIIVHGVLSLIAPQVLWFAVTTGFEGRITMDDHRSAGNRRRS